MLSPQLVERFNECVDRLLAGATIEECLRVYPEDAAALRPLLESGEVIRRIQPTDAEVAAAQARGQARLDTALAQPYLLDTSIRRWLTTVGRIAAIFALVLFGAAYVAESALPGDALYPLKRFTEDARGALGGEAVRESFAARRVDEVRELLAQGRSAFVTFTGDVEAIGSATWRVAGIPLLVTGATSIDAHIDVGDSAQVSGLTTPEGTLLVSAIRLQDDRQITPPTPAATPTAITTPTATASPTTQPTVTASPTLTPTVPILPNPTQTLPPLPTTAPQPDPESEDEDHSDDDGGNSNSGSGSENSGRGNSDDDADESDDD